LSPVTRAEATSAARWAERIPVMVSAATGEGIDGLLNAIDTRLGHADEVLDLVIPAHEGRLVNWLYEEAEVLDRVATETGEVRMRLRIASEKRERLNAQVRRAGGALSAV
jgi:GTP-binding protein HflX